MIRVVFVFLTIVFFCVPVFAQDITLCDELKSESVYQDNKSFRHIVSAENGWFFRSQTDFKTKFSTDENVIRNFQSLDKAFKSQNIELVLAVLPSKGMTSGSFLFDSDKAWDSYALFTRKLNQVGVKTAYVEKSEIDNNFFYKRDHHWQAEGARIMAKKTANLVKAIDSFKKIKKKEFITEANEVYGHEGSLAKFVSNVCGQKVIPEKISRFQTYSSDSSEAGLFGDDEVADIVLLGTSNSVQKNSQANFDGFLKEYIAADVENFAIAGGGFDTALFQWLQSNSYKTHKPKIVVWEFPFYQNYADGDFYKQAIPAVFGDCQMTNSDMNVADNVAIYNMSKPKVFNNHYVIISVKDFADRKARFFTKRGEDIITSLKMERSNNYQSNGVFYADVSSVEESDTFKLILPNNKNNKVSLKICSYPENYSSSL